MGVPEIRRLKQLEDENSKLKKLVTDLTLDRAILTFDSACRDAANEPSSGGKINNERNESC